MRVSIGDCWVSVLTDQQYVATQFSDGTRIVAVPVDEPWESTRLHDLLHSLIAEAREEPFSKALWNKAHPDIPQYHPADIALEEARVLRFQKVLQDLLEEDSE